MRSTCAAIEANRAVPAIQALSGQGVALWGCGLRVEIAVACRALLVGVINRGSSVVALATHLTWKPCRKARLESASEVYQAWSFGMTSSFNEIFIFSN